MIVDHINRLESYSRLGIHVDKILEFIRYAKSQPLHEGRYDILGDDLYALVQKYETKERTKCQPETHVNHIDLQYIVHGEEHMLWHDKDMLQPIVRLDRKLDDIYFYHREPEQGIVRLKAGYFALLFPADAHTPCIKIDEIKPVYKIVFKIYVN